MYLHSCRPPKAVTSNYFSLTHRDVANVGKLYGTIPTTHRDVANVGKLYGTIPTTHMDVANVDGLSGTISADASAFCGFCFY
jgi:hypothetical protein